MRRGGKIAIIIGIVTVILIGIAIAVYSYFINKTVYHVTGVEKNEFTVADFVEKSELQLNKNGTFHITIQHKEKGLSLTGIGTYTLDGKNYQLSFFQAFGRDNEGHIIDYTEICNDKIRDKEISCKITGNRIKFTDHKNQTFYFG